MRGVESEGAMDLEDLDEMAEIFGSEGDLAAVETIGDDLEAKAGVEDDAESEPEVEEDEDLLEPDFEKLGKPVRNFSQDDNELEALIDADFEAEDEDEFEIAMLQEMGIEISEDSLMIMSAMEPESGDPESFDDDVAA